MATVITKERFRELGLGYDLEACASCEECVEKDGKLYCGNSKESINDILANDECAFCECCDEERLRDEMSEEEYDAYRHNRLEVR